MDFRKQFHWNFESLTKMFGPLSMLQILNSMLQEALEWSVNPCPVKKKQKIISQEEKTVSGAVLILQISIHIIFGAMCEGSMDNPVNE